MHTQIGGSQRSLSHSVVAISHREHVESARVVSRQGYCQVIRFGARIDKEYDLNIPPHKCTFS